MLKISIRATDDVDKLDLADFDDLARDCDLSRTSLIQNLIATLPLLVRLSRRPPKTVDKARAAYFSGLLATFNDLCGRPYDVDAICQQYALPKSRAIANLANAFLKAPDINHRAYCCGVVDALHHLLGENLPRILSTPPGIGDRSEGAAPADHHPSPSAALASHAAAEAGRSARKPSRNGDVRGIASASATDGRPAHFREG